MTQFRREVEVEGFDTVTVSRHQWSSVIMLTVEGNAIELYEHESKALRKALKRAENHSA